jgi:hypothetical protein
MKPKMAVFAHDRLSLNLQGTGSTPTKVSVAKNRVDEITMPSKNRCPNPEGLRPLDSLLLAAQERLSRIYSL